MYDNSSDGRSFVRVGASVYKTNTQLENIIPSDYVTSVPYVGDDVFLSGVNLRSGFLSGFVPTAGILGIPKSDFEHPFDVSFVVHKPHVTRYDSRVDIERYYAPGSSFFRGFPDGTFNRENDVEHYAYRGSVRDLHSGGDLYSFFQNGSYPTNLINVSVGREGVVPFIGLNRTDVYGSKSLARIGTDSVGHGIFDTSTGFSFSHGRPDFLVSSQLAAWDSWMSTYGTADRYIGYGALFGRYRNWVNLSSCDAGLNRGTVDIAYDYGVGWVLSPSSVSLKYFRVHLVADYEFGEFYSTNNPSSYNLADARSFNYNVKQDVEYIGNDDTIGGVGYVHPGYLPEFRVYDLSVASLLVQEEATAVPNFVSYRFADKNFLNRRTDLFKRSVETVMDDILPSSFLSSADAMNKHLEALTANHVQTLSQLDGILGLLPDIAGIPSLVKKIADGDYSAIKDLIDYLTDAILRYRFAQKPNARNLEEILGTDVQGFLDRLGRSTSSTIYGSFKWEFPDYQNFMEDGKLVLETRSKVRVTADASTLVESCLMANAVGLLPTLSRIWESLPFTFVVDWFIAMNKRLKLLDTQLAYMAFRTDWCEHSYKVVYYPSQESLSAYHLESFDLRKPFGISAYYRQKSVFMPRLLNSRYDFVSAGGANAITAGSLLWQLFS